MFVERAQQGCPGFVLTVDNAAVIGTLCSRLEGLPLAIELAAAWTRTLSPAQIEKRLTSCLNLLVTTQKDVPARHASLRAALDGSYQLLAKPLQTFLAKLSVFRGGLTLEAAEAVCEEPNTLSYLAQLCEGSLVIAETSGEVMRYRLLEMVLEYAREKLQDNEVDIEALQRQHAHYFRQWAQAQEKQFLGEHTARILRELDADYDNLRTALEWCAEQGEQGIVEANDEGLILANALWHYWISRGYWHDGIECLDRLLGNAQGDKAVRASAMGAGGNLTSSSGHSQRSRAYYEASVLLHQQTGNKLGEARMQASLGTVAMNQGNDEEARVAFEKTLATARELGDALTIAVTITNLGSVACKMSDYELGMRYFQESIILSEQLKDRYSVGFVLINISWLHQYMGQYPDAKPPLRLGLKVAEELEDKSLQQKSVFAGAFLEVGLQQWERGALLLSAAEAMRSRLEIEMIPEHALEETKTKQKILAHVDAATFEKWRERGLTLSWKEITALIYEPSPSDPLPLP